MRRLFLILISIIISLPITAQQISNSERRAMNARILHVIEDYESSSILYKDESEDVFLSLFQDSSSMVFCDILGNSKFRQQIPVSEYVSYARAVSKSASTKIKVVRKSESKYQSGKWITDVTFRKSYNYIDKNGILYSSVEYFQNTDFSLTLHISYDEETGRCYISSIDGKMENNRSFPSGEYLVVKKNPNEEDVLEYNGNKLEFNSFEQAFVENGSLTSSDPDLRIKADTLARGDRYKYVQYNYKYVNWRVRPRFGFAPVSAYKVDFDMNPNVGSSKSSAMEFGVDFGYSFKLGRKSKLGAYAGFALSKSKIEFSTDKIQYAYQLSTPNPGVNSTYSRQYTIDKATEGLEFTDYVIPVYFEAEHKLGKVVTLTWDLGAKIYLNNKVDAESTPYSVIGSVYALDQKISLDGNYSAFMTPGSYKRVQTDISAFASIGLDFRVVNAFFISAQVGYELAFSPSFNPGRNAWFIQDEGLYPFVYNSALGKDVPVSSFMNSISYTRKALWFNLGVKFKF